jgi:hypothetical protein
MKDAGIAQPVLRRDTNWTAWIKSSARTRDFSLLHSMEKMSDLKNMY